MADPKPKIIQFHPLSQTEILVLLDNGTLAVTEYARFGGIVTVGETKELIAGDNLAVTKKQ